MSDEEGVVDGGSEVEAPDLSGFEEDFNKLYNTAETPEAPESEAALEADVEAEEGDEEPANPFEAMLKDSDEDVDDDDESDDDEDVEVETKPDEEEKESPKQGRAQKRIRQLNTRAKEAEEQRDNIYQEALAIRSQANAMRNKFDTWAEGAKKELEAARQERDSLKAELEIYSSEEFDSEDPTARARARLVKELRDKELTPVKRELLALKQAEQRREQQFKQQQKQQSIKQEADKFRSVTAAAVDKTLLQGIDADTFNATDRKLLNAALLGFQANGISPEQAAQHMKQVMAKWSVAQLKTKNAPKAKALKNSAKLPRKARQEPVAPSSREPTMEELEAAGLTGPRWEMLGRPSLDTLK